MSSQPAETFNLLNLLATVHIEQQFPELEPVGLPVIKNLESWLMDFPSLLIDDVFKGKIKNLDRDSFLSTLSELLVAAELHRMGHRIKFEHKFTIPVNDGKRDVDLTITCPNNDPIHIEVYSPYLPAENGFMSRDDADEPLSKKVSIKMYDKFGEGEVDGLKGKVLLAVDTQKIDMLQIRERLTGQSSVDKYTDMANYMVPVVDGYLFFRGQIGDKQSFIFEKWVLKNKLA